MNLLSPSVKINGSEVARVLAKQSLTIPATGWVANTGDYAYKNSIAISGITSLDYILVDILPDDADIAANANISKFCLEYDGGITLYAKSIPTAAISAKYTKLRGD